jgi:hypothetical protein
MKPKTILATILAALLAAVLPALLLSCSPIQGSGGAFGALGRHELTLVLPPAPAAWACLPDLRMAVTWKDPGGGLRSALAMPGSRLRVELDRGRPQAILALPSSSGRTLLPAGALYPEGQAGGELVLDWKGGYAASIAAALCGGGVDPWGYDLSRLARDALARCADPWLLPALEAARRLAALDFRIDAYADPPRSAVVLPGGPWAPDSPFEPAPEASSSGDVTAGDVVAMLPEGLMRFLGPGGELLVSVDGEGRARFVRRQGRESAQR